MIRRSTTIAAVALIVSLILHLLGLSIPPPREQSGSADSQSENAVELATSFEDLAETAPEPVEPEPAPSPEPQELEEPTSDARVASDNPQQTAQPDTGVSSPGPSQSMGPVTPELGVVPDPVTTDPSQGDATERIASPVPPATQAAEAETANAETAVTEPAEASVAEASLPTETEAPAPEQLAALPPLAPVTPPSASAPQPPAESEITAPVPEADEAVLPDVSQAPDEAPPAEEQAEGESPLAVARSLRPQAPSARPPPTPPSERTSLSRGDLSARATTRTIESPLTAYQRDGTDVFAGQRGGRRSGGLGFLNSGGPGNATETNYAGQVLVHLNRVPPVPVSGRGWARVVFQIEPNGSLAWVDVIDGTGSASIDRAAKQQIRTAAPFPKPPSGRSRKLNFVYQIQ